MIEEGWVLLFGKYDVFAQGREPTAPQGAGGTQPFEPVGAGGLAVSESPARLVTPAASGIPTHGAKRAVLRSLRWYWVNSGIAVALMLLLGLGNGYAVVWSIFGSANQLLAALALWVGMIWLMSKGKQYWFALVPAVFMFATSMTMLVRLLMKYLDGWQAGKSGMLALLIADAVVLLMTAGVLLLTVWNWLAKRAAATVGGSTQEAG